MEYAPRHAQPFTLSEAMLLDVSSITEEIARLQHSIEHLNRTQNELQAAVSSSAEPDQEFLDAMDENKIVISAQEERMGMLRMVLARKGVSASSAHYEMAAEERADEDDGGIHL